MRDVDTIEVRVQGYHCDLYGHVNNARYLEFLEGARWEGFGRHIDIEAFHRRGWAFVVVRIEIDYRAPATLGDLLEVRTTRHEIGRSSASVRQRIFRPADGKQVAEAIVRFVVIDTERGRPLKVQGLLREELERLPLDESATDEDGGERR